MGKCVYFSQCNYSDIRACNKDYESCIIYQKKIMLEKEEVKKVRVYFDEPKALESKLS